MRCIFAYLLVIGYFIVVVKHLLFLDIRFFFLDPADFYGIDYFSIVLFRASKIIPTCQP